MNRLKYGLLFAIVIFITACGGGGGGGGSGSPYSTSNPYLRSNVPYATPQLVGVHTPITTTTDKTITQEPFSVDLNGTGSQSVIFAGRMSRPADTGTWGNYNMSLYTWSGNQLVDKTAQWFPGGINEIVGSEPSVKFASFNNNGRMDMLVTPSTDGVINGGYGGDAYVYFNQGNSFNRIALPLNNVWSHDSTIADINGDGFKDIVVSDYGWKTTIALNNQNSSFKLYTQATNVLPGNSSIAAADYLGNGQTQLIAIDTGGTGNPTKMYSWSINGSDQLNFTEVATLPTPRFELPKWSSYNFGGGTGNPSHNIRIFNFDFDNSGKNSVVILSAPSNTPGMVGNYSEIQFLKNNGTGTFTDVTDTTVSGYNTRTMVSYNPKLLDINNDGLTDILLSSNDYSGKNTSHQILLHKSDHTYTAAYQNVLTDFVTQTNALAAAKAVNNYQFNGGNALDIIKSPDGKLYFITAVQYFDGSSKKNAVYLSLIGDPSSPTYTAAQTLSQVKALWPYLSDVQANQVLAKTASNYYGIAQVLDPESILSPVGQFSINSIRGMTPITGYISGVQLKDTTAVVMDELQRSYTVNLRPMNVQAMNSFGYNTEHIDQHQLTSHTEYLINGQPTTVGAFRMGSDTLNRFGGPGGTDGPVIGPMPRNFTMGMPKYYQKGNWSAGMQYTQLSVNPWMAFTGAWGQINSSTTLDHVVRYQNNGFISQTGVMQTSTNMAPGLVTKVNNIYGMWHESGYKWNDLGLYAGVKPVALSGSIEARLPTSVDNQGNTLYTNTKLPIQSTVTPYVRALYTGVLNKQTLYKLSAMSTFTGQYRLMSELKFFFD